MRRVLYILIIILACLVPIERLDVAKLQPVEALAVCAEQDTVLLLTDTEDSGKGKTVQQALENLKETTTAVIYLDTAEYLLVGPGAESYGEELKVYLKNSVKVREYAGGEVKEEVKYLDAHDRSAVPETDEK